MVLGVDIIIDMIRTMTNVTGSSVVELIVSSYGNSNTSIDSGSSTGKSGTSSESSSCGKSSYSGAKGGSSSS